MNKVTAALAALFGMAAAAGVAAAEETSGASAWTTTFASEARYFSWTSTRGYPVGVAGAGHGSGAEVYVPFALQIVGHPNDDWKLEILGRGGWVWAQQFTPGLSGEVATTTDPRSPRRSLICK